MFNKSIDRALGFLEIPVCSIVFIAMCFVLLFQIIFRTVGFPLAWTEEFARYLFSWIIFLGGSRATKLSQQLKVEIIVTALKGRPQQVFLLIGNAISFVFLLVLCFYCFVIVHRLGVHPQFGQGSGINMLFPYMAPALGTAMMTVRCVQNCLVHVRHIKRPPTREGEAE
jgi:TRAP-type C4-dicarboxylate transport system permease small subunit